MWTLATHLVPSQVKTYGAGSSRILQALGRRPETLSSHGPEEEKTQLPALHLSQEPRGLRGCPTSNPRRPAQHSRHEAKGSADQEWGSLPLLFHRVREPLRVGEAGP